MNKHQRRYADSVAWRPGFIVELDGSVRRPTMHLSQRTACLNITERAVFKAMNSSWLQLRKATK